MDLIEKILLAFGLSILVKYLFLILKNYKMYIHQITKILGTWKKNETELVIVNEIHVAKK